MAPSALIRVACVLTSHRLQAPKTYKETEMKKVIRSISIVTVMLGLLVTVAQAAPAAGPSNAPAAAAPAPAPAHAPMPAAKGPFQRDLLGVYSYSQNQVLQLLDAIPQNKFNWRPAPGVRSVAEVFLHIAFSNYGLTKMATGKEPPADAGWEMNPTKWDKKATDKAEIKKILEQSFAHVHAVLGAVPDSDLDKMVNMMGHEMTERSVLIILASHLNEHLGQAIAYARTNKIVPPWTKDQKTAMKE
jgi:uncharacterized damage-inducible protein DinB